MFRVGLVFVGCFSLLCYPVSVESSSSPSSPSWNSWFGSDDEQRQEGGADDDGTMQQQQHNTKKTLVSPIVNRELEASVIAHGWPTSPQSVFCEAAAYYKSNNNNKDGNNNGKEESFYDRLAETLSSREGEEDSWKFTYRTATDAVLRAVSRTDDDGTASESESALLEWSLAMRASSPACELHRQLARQALKQQQQQQRLLAKDLDGFLILYPAGKVIALDDDEFDDDWSSSLLPMGGGEDDAGGFDISSVLLPDEVPIAGGSGDDDDDDGPLLPLVILHANLGTPTFVRAYQQLKQQRVRFVVRHLGIVDFEDQKDYSATATSGGGVAVTALQGYGVRLDIRNVEYKVFDDGGDEGDEEHQGWVNLTALALNEGGEEEQTEPARVIPAQFLAGVNLTALFATQERDQDDGGDEEQQHHQQQQRSLLLAELWNVHDAHQHYAQIVPPVWQRRQLPLQAAAVIASAADPLQTLQEVSQDLPSLASTLVHIKIPPTIHALAKTLEQNPKIGGRSGVAGKLYINGRVISSLTSPSWNVFKLLQVLQEETQATRKLQETLSPYLSAMTMGGAGASAAALLKVQEAWIMGDASFLERYKPKEQQKSKEDLMMMEEDVDDEEDDDDMDGGGAGSPSSSEASLFRIDVGRGWRQAVLYLNDLERDPEYAQWTRSLQQFLMNMQFGMPPSIRRNLFTFLAVMDPAQHSADNPAVLLGLQLLQQSQFPARIGMLVVAQADIDTCQAWVSSSSSATAASEQSDKTATSSASAPCPVPVMFEEMPTMETLASTPGTAQAAHRIMVHFYHEYSTTAPGSWIAYMEYFGTMIIEKRNQAKAEALSSSTEEETSNTQEKKTGKFVPTVADLIEIHCELVENMQMGVTEEEARPKAIQALVGPEDETNDKTIGLYGKSVRFAVDKGLRPGMGFLNGRPIPSDPDASEDDDNDGSGGGQATEAMQTLFTSEQQVVFGMIYKGAIRDHAPKSVYGKLLTGPNVYPKSHPLLFANDNTNNNQDAYLQAVHHGFGADNSALVVKHIGNDTDNSQGEDSTSPDAYVAVEGYLDWSTQTGLRNVQTLLSLAAEFDGTVVRKGGGAGKSKNAVTRVQLAVQFVPSTAAAASAALCPLLAANAGTVGIEVLRTAVQKVLDAAAAETDGEATAEMALEELLGDDVVDEAVRQNVLASAENGPCATARALDDALPSNNLVAVNGRIYAPTSPSILTRNDLDLLFQLELERAQAVTTMLTSSGGDGDNEEDNQIRTEDVRATCDAVGRTAAFLAVAARSGRRRSNILHYVNTLEQQMEFPEGEKTNPLRFSWNNDGGDHDATSTGLKVQITAVVDPVSEAAQRMSPLLVILRDHLKLPVNVLLTPATLIDGDSKVPITSYYRFVADPKALPDDDGNNGHMAHLNFLPTNHVLTLRMDVPEPWDVQQTAIVQDTDNLRCDINKGLCSDEAAAVGDQPVGLDKDKQQRRRDVTRVEYGLNGLLIFGQCYESTGSPPNGLQLNLYRNTNLHLADATTVQADSGGGGAGQEQEGEQQQEVEIGMDGSTTITQQEPPKAEDPSSNSSSASALYSDTLVMKNVGYWQLRANPGVWNVKIAEDSKGAKMFQMIEGVIRAGRIKILPDDKQKSSTENTKTLVMKDFVNTGEILLVKRRKGYEKASLFFDEKDRTKIGKKKKKKTKRSLSSANENKTKDPNDDADDGDDEVVHVFSLATGHLYERFLKIMMLSVTKRTSAPVKFWLFENFLSPTFKTTAKAMADRIGCQVEFVTYKWPEWLRGQSEKQRIIWGYKILFLDVLFPMSVKKIIYVDADQVVRGDLKELWELDLKGAPYGYTPMCSSRETTLGYQFWRDGFWKTHLRDKPYHISALYVVDLETFRRNLVGDQLRSIYQQLSADPNSLANLDQDLPNYAQHQVPIHSLPQEWLWCESWCSDETKAAAKTIDLCNNPLHKEPKVSMAKRVISGPLFEESWVELDAEVERYEKEEFRRQQGLATNATTTSTS